MTKGDIHCLVKGLSGIEQHHHTGKMNNKTISIIQEGETLCDLAAELVHKGDYQLAIHHYEQAEAKFKSVQDINWIVFAQHERFICLQNLENYEVAAHLSKEIIENYQFLEKCENLSLFLIQLANVYMANNKNGIAIETLRMAEDIALEHQMTHIFAHTYSNIAACLINLQHYTGALEYLNKAIAEYQQQNQEHGVAWCYENTGRCYEELFLNDEAEKNYFKAQRRFVALKEPKSALGALKSLVNLYGISGKKEKEKQIQDIILQIEN